MLDNPEDLPRNMHTVVHIVTFFQEYLATASISNFSKRFFAYLTLIFSYFIVDQVSNSELVQFGRYH